MSDFAATMNDHAYNTAACRIKKLLNNLRSAWLATKAANHAIALCFFILMGSTSECSQQVQNQAFQNPILPGFHPDPSICRVGEDYYMVTNSSEYFPGIPVYHSKDLINWRIAGYVLDRPSQLNLDGVECSRGIFAPTIRYHRGVFYVLSTLTGAPAGQPEGNFIVTATNPEGPWSDPCWLPDANGIDPSIFFDDDGKAYYHGNYSPSPKEWANHRNLWIQEMDLGTMRLTGPRADIINGFDYYNKGTLDGGILSGVDFFEAPHIYKKDGMYYLVAGHGGTFKNHAVSIWRSKDIFGPYESNPGNPIMTHRDLPPDHEITSVGHADFIQTQNGEWWMVYLGRRPYGGEVHILGRETFLSPVDWSGEWPVVNPAGRQGRSESSHQRPRLKEHKWPSNSGIHDFSDDIKNSPMAFLRTPHSQWWSLTDRPGYLRMQIRPEEISEIANPSFIGLRQVYMNGIAETSLEFAPGNENEEAGMVVIRDRNNYFRFTLSQKKGTPVISLFKRYNPLNEDELAASAFIDCYKVKLRVIAEGVYYTFAYSTDDHTWETLAEKVDGSFLGMDGAGRFTGTFKGLYASSNGTDSGNSADFDYFKSATVDDFNW
jgi:xylan 1,4-beta-xylosidase